MPVQKNGSPSGAADTASTTNNLKAGADQAVDQAKEKVKEAGGKAAETAKAQFANRKDRVADDIDNVASALRRTGEQLRDEDTGFVGDYVSKAADAVSNISQNLREKDLDQLLHETEDFARREPTIFLGSAFALGMIAARFLKSSSERRYAASRGANTDRFSGYQPSRVGDAYDRDYSDYGRDDSESMANRGW